MNADQAKKLSLPDLLAQLGYEPMKVLKGGRELWYPSPFRVEKDPSFHTSYLGGKWIWNDFGDTGGTVIDFVMRHQNFSRVSEALRFLEKMFPGTARRRVGEGAADHPSLFSFQQQGPPQASKKISEAPVESAADRDLELVKIMPLQSHLIFSYLEGRMIPRELAQKYLVLVHYRNKKKPSQRPYFAFGMRNRSGGYEIRSASDDPNLKFKSALVTRDITVISGREQGRGAVNVFEGQLDFLSLLVMLDTDQLGADSIILNGLQSYSLAKGCIEERGYELLNTFLDNNSAGQGRTQDFINDFGSIVVNHSPKFLPHVDLNDALRSGHNPFVPRTDNVPRP